MVRMKHARKNLSDTEVALTITLESVDLAESKQKTLQRLAKKIKVAGFRTGKVPISVAEKQLDSTVLHNEVAEDAINQAVIEVLRAEQLQPLDRPKVALDKYIPGELLECTITVTILPAIKLADYKKLTATQPDLNVTDQNINDVIERMRLGMGKKEAVGRPARVGDEVMVDFEGRDDQDKPVAGAKGTDYPLMLGSDSFIPGFEAGLIGKKTGETVTLPLTFPKEYHHKPLAGASVTFTVTVKKVSEITLPEVNDDFAASCGPFKTVDELRADIKRELTDQKEREALDKLKDELVEELVKGSHIPAPEVLITDQIASLERDFTQNLLYRGQSLEQYLEEHGLTREAWQQKELREQAIRRVKIGLALAELSKLEKIEASPDELNQRLAELLQTYGNDAKIRNQLDMPEVRRDIANRLVTEKTVNRLVELNK